MATRSGRGRDPKLPKSRKSVNPVGDSSQVCWQLQVLETRSSTWKDCGSSQLNASGVVCAKKGVQYRMKPGEAKLGEPENPVQD